MGALCCFGGRQAVDDEPQPLPEGSEKSGLTKEAIAVEELRPATAPPGPAEKKLGAAPVPSTSSLDSSAAPQTNPWGTSPAKSGGNPGSWAAGHRPSTGPAASEHGSLVSQDSMGSTSSAPNQRPKSPLDNLDQLASDLQRRRNTTGSADAEQQQHQVTAAQRAATAAAAAAALGGEQGAAGRGQPQPQEQASGLGAIRNHTGDPIAATTFTFKELERATKGFSPHNFVGEGGFGRVYKGKLESTGQIVAVKQLDRNGLQGNREFLVEVLMLSLLHHPNLVQLIGYCADGDQRLLVYEFMANGALEDHLHDLPEGKEPLDWNMRMKVAAGAARGLEYLHDKASPPVIYRDFKSSNILLDETWHPKLSDFGLAKLGPVGDKTHVSTRVMGTYGYCAPEYAMTGQLTVKSDVYSFGVVLLELITGRKAIDNTRPPGEHNLVAWARPLFKDRRKFPAMADPRLQGKYPMRGLYQALAVAAMCLQEQASQRPMIHDVVTALSYLAAQHYDPNAPPPQRFSPGTPQNELGRDRRGSRSPQVRGLSSASPRASPAHHHGSALRRGGSPNSPGLGPLGATSSARGYRESPGRSGLGSGRSTPNHPLTRASPHHQHQSSGSENQKTVQQPQPVQG